MSADIITLPIKWLVLCEVLTKMVLSCKVIVCNCAVFCLSVKVVLAMMY